MISKEEAIIAARKYQEEELNILEVTAVPPEGFYGIDRCKNAWFVICSQFPEGTSGVGGSRFIAVDKNSGAVLSNNIVGE